MLRALKSKIADRLRRRWGVPDMGDSLRRLQEAGFKPEHVLDIGAYQGDFAALTMAVWPDAAISCFEPQPGRAEAINARFGSGSRVRAYPLVLGPKSGDTVELSLRETASSVLAEREQAAEATVQLVTRSLDDWQVETNAAPAQLLKLDVQGYELAILQGGQRVLSAAEVLILEVNLLDIHVGVPLLDEVIGWLRSRDFVAFDVAGLTRRPLDRALWQVDLVFVRPDSKLRQDKRWQA